MTHESYVSLETARLLKEAGFDWGVYTYYSQRDNFKELIHAESSPCNANEYREPSHYWQAISAPTLDVAQRWLREVKDMIISTQYTSEGWKAVVTYPKPLPEHIHLEYVFCGDTYEEALEAGIKKCLTLVLENKYGKTTLRLGTRPKEKSE